MIIRVHCRSQGSKVTRFLGAGPLRSLAGLLAGWGRQIETCFLLLDGKRRGLPVGGIEGHVFLFGMTNDALRVRELSLYACPTPTWTQIP